MAHGGQKSSKIMWVDTNDLNVYKGEAPAKITISEATETGYTVEICETGKEEEEAVLKPDVDSAEEDQELPGSNSSLGGRGCGRGRGRGYKPRGISRVPRSRRRRFGRSRLSGLGRVGFCPSPKRQRISLHEYKSDGLLVETKEENDDPDYVMLEDEFALSRKRSGYQPSGDSFPCHVCSKTFLPTTLSSHVRNHHPDFPETQCYICGKNFANSTIAQSHLKADHLSNYSYHCPECGKGYHYYMKIIRHLRNVHTYVAVPTREELRSIGKSRLPDIVLNSQEPKQNECRCIVCRRIFRIDEIKDHVYERHQEFPKTQCVVCDRRFSSTTEAEEHMESAHFKLSPISCPECILNFKDLQEWSKHMEHIHQSDIVYRCEQCYMVFGWKKYLRKHIRQDHSGSGSIFALRGDFRAEKTTLKEECDRQQRLIDAENSRFAENGTMKVNSTDATHSTQNSPMSINRLSSEPLEAKGAPNGTPENASAETEVSKIKSLSSVMRKHDFLVSTSRSNDASIDTNSSQFRIVDSATDLNAEGTFNEIADTMNVGVANSSVSDEGDGAPLSEIGLHEVAFEGSDGEIKVSETVAHSLEDVSVNKQDGIGDPSGFPKFEGQNCKTEINRKASMKGSRQSSPFTSGHIEDPENL